MSGKDSPGTLSAVHLRLQLRGEHSFWEPKFTPSSPGTSPASLLLSSGQGLITEEA